MKQTESATIFQFPTERASRRGAAGSELSDGVEEYLPLDDGALALDGCPFEIDEPDPLLCVEGRGGDLSAAPGPAFSVVETGLAPGEARRRVRLRDLHPMDVAIIAGFLVIVAMI